MMGDIQVVVLALLQWQAAPDVALPSMAALPLSFSKPWPRAGLGAILSCKEILSRGRSL